METAPAPLPSANTPHSSPREGEWEGSLLTQRSPALSFFGKEWQVLESQGTGWGGAGRGTWTGVLWP